MQQNTNNNSNEIVLAKFNYTAQDTHELSIAKNERLVLVDDSFLWWKVKRLDSDETGYIPSNFARREKRSLLEKLISKRINKKPAIPAEQVAEKILSIALVKFRYDAESEDEISLNKGLWVHVLQKKNDGWWFVQYEHQRGWFPSNYLLEKTNDGLNSLSLINQLKSHHSSSSSNGLSSSSSANSNLVESDPTRSNRHNSHPTHMLPLHDEYAFVIKPSKFAHSDGKLDACLISSPVPQAKNSSWSGLIPYESSPASSLFHQDSLDGLALKLRQKDSLYASETWYYGCLTREEAEQLLKTYGHEQGEYLVRNSERKLGSYSLSIRETNASIRHFRIEFEESLSKFLIGKRSFATLHDLIEHYSKHPIYDGNPTKKLYLTSPLIVHDSNSQF